MLLPRILMMLLVAPVLMLHSASAIDGEIAALAVFECASLGSSVMVVDSSTGDRRVLSGSEPSGAGDCVAVGAGPDLQFATGLAADSGGDYLLVDVDEDIGGGRLLGVNSTTGDRTILSGCTSDALNCDPVGAGPPLGEVSGLAVISAEAASSNPAFAGHEGDVILSQYADYTGCGGPSLVRVDRDTGDRTVLSGLDSTCALVGLGDPFSDVESLSITADGIVWVGDGDGSARLMRVNAASGDRTVVSGCPELDAFGFSCLSAEIGNGPVLSFVGGIVQPNPPVGPLLISGFLDCGFAGSILSVDASNGDRTVISGEDSSCNAVVGNGTNFTDLGGLSLAADGSLVTEDEDFTARILNVDPSTGDRSAVSGCSDYPPSAFSCDPPASILGSGPEWQGVSSAFQIIPVPEPRMAQGVASGIAALLALGSLGGRKGRGGQAA